jgi:hypothetical protein
MQPLKMVFESNITESGLSVFAKYCDFGNLKPFNFKLNFGKRFPKFNLKKLKGFNFLSATSMVLFICSQPWIVLMTKFTAHSSTVHYRGLLLLKVMQTNAYFGHCNVTIAGERSQCSSLQGINISRKVKLWWVRLAESIPQSSTTECRRRHEEAFFVKVVNELKHLGLLRFGHEQGTCESTEACGPVHGRRPSISCLYPGPLFNSS